MSQVINELATIEISNDILQQLDVRSLGQNFSNNFRKLDDLKNFRAEYEKENWLMRWWHNDKLRDAQLGSIEVQAEFSKTIGQLMVISLMQSKKLAEQQVQLNDQQGKLRAQAEGITDHACELQKQHEVLADQSAKLETLVREYFELKGLSEDGAQKLVEIAKDIKTTKEGMLQEFAARAKDFEVRCGEMTTQMETLSEKVDDQIHISVEQTQSEMAILKQETREALLASESALRLEHELALQVSSQSLTALEQSLCDTEANLLVKSNKLGTDLATMLAEQDAAHQKKLQLIEDGINTQSVRITEITSVLAVQKAHQEGLARFQQVCSLRMKHLSLVVVCIATVVVAILFGMAHLLKWI
jgi:hypothetical protein